MEKVILLIGERITLQDIVCDDALLGFFHSPHENVICRETI